MSATTGPTAGYSGTPLHRKLGVKPGHDVLVVRPAGLPAATPADAVFDPEGSARVWPFGSVPGRDPGSDGEVCDVETFDVVVAFCADAAMMGSLLPAAMAVTTTAGRCWVCRPKQASKVPTDLTEHVIRGAALAVGWVDVKVCAVDEVWSGLCVVRRVENR